MLNFCDFIQVFVFTTNHHLKFYVPGSFPLLQGIETILENASGIFTSYSEAECSVVSK